MGAYFVMLVVTSGRRLGDLIGVLLVTPVAGLVAALVVTFVLPRGARGAFWVNGLLCILAAALLWGIGCAIALSQH
jgi:hypothetical protein